MQTYALDDDGDSTVPSVSVAVKDLLSPFMPIKLSNKRSKRSSTHGASKKQAIVPASSVEPVATTAGGQARDEATEHDFDAGVDDAAAAIAANADAADGIVAGDSGKEAATPPVVAPSPPPTAGKRKSPTVRKPVPGYCEFCEITFDDMHTVSGSIVFAVKTEVMSDVVTV